MKSNEVMVQPISLQNQKHYKMKNMAFGVLYIKWFQKSPSTKSKTCLEMIQDTQPSPTKKCFVPNVNVLDFVVFFGGIQNNFSNHVLNIHFVWCSVSSLNKLHKPEISRTQINNPE